MRPMRLEKLTRTPNNGKKAIPLTDVHVATYIKSNTLGECRAHILPIHGGRRLCGGRLEAYSGLRVGRVPTSFCFGGTAVWPHMAFFVRRRLEGPSRPMVSKVSTSAAERQRRALPTTEPARRVANLPTAPDRTRPNNEGGMFPPSLGRLKREGPGVTSERYVGCYVKDCRANGHGRARASMRAARRLRV